MFLEVALGVIGALMLPPKALTKGALRLPPKGLKMGICEEPTTLRGSTERELRTGVAGAGEKDCFNKLRLAASLAGSVQESKVAICPIGIIGIAEVLRDNTEGTVHLELISPETTPGLSRRLAKGWLQLAGSISTVP